MWPRSEDDDEVVVDRSDRVPAVKDDRYIQCLAANHGRAGREAVETELLTLLAERHGRHECGAKAAKELAKRAG